MVEVGMADRADMGMEDMVVGGMEDNRVVGRVPEWALDNNSVFDDI